MSASGLAGNSFFVAQSDTETNPFESTNLLMLAAGKTCWRFVSCSGFPISRSRFLDLLTFPRTHLRVGLIGSRYLLTFSQFFLSRIRPALYNSATKGRAGLVNHTPRAARERRGGVLISYRD